MCYSHERYVLHSVSLHQNGVHYMQVMKKEEHFKLIKGYKYLLGYVHIETLHPANVFLS